MGLVIPTYILAYTITNLQQSNQNDKVLFIALTLLLQVATTGTNNSLTDNIKAVYEI